MIQLFEFQKKEIRTEIIGSDIWFSGQDIYSVLEMTWRGGNGLRKEKGIPESWITIRGVETSGGLQDMVFINEQAVYKIVFTSKPKTEHIRKSVEKFQIWIAETLVKLRQSVQNGNIEDFRKHLYVETQKDYSKKINSKNFNSGGVEKTIEYNRKNCKLHTGKLPNEIISLGKSIGLKSNQRTSAKEVIRNIKPELACSMSFTDKLVCENGINHEEACKTSIQLAQPLFKKLMELGISSKQLEK